MANSVTFTRQEGLVIFAGAGCSMAPPSSLPGWYDLNDAILDSLWDRLEDYRITKGFREKILPAIKKHRGNRKFPPDYQAQLMAERVGIHYFDLLSVVDASTFNPVQYYTALLAKEGLVKAVVTTNFDQNFERAFQASGTRHRTYFDEVGFNSISDTRDDSIPIIKIHGTCASPASMIDTRKQRLKGRSVVLEQVLKQLLHKYHFVFAGYSGEDFDDNANYLGFRDAAANAIGFTYLSFPGSKLRKSMRELIYFYNEHKTSSIECDPVNYLEEQLQKLEINYKPFEMAQEKAIPIEEKLAVKIADLQPMDAINMLTALIESYGDEISARFLYDKIWKNRDPEDYKGDGMSRFLLNYSRSFVFNFQTRLERAETAGVPIETVSIADPPEGVENYFNNPAMQNMRHIKNTSPENIGLIALAQTYMGNPILFCKFPDRLATSFQAEPSHTEMADIIYYYSHYAVIYNNYDRIYEYLNLAVKYMEEEYDEPRLSCLLSRRALIKFRNSENKIIQSGEKDALYARELAEKYHEPGLLALSYLALATGARAKADFIQADEFIQKALNKFLGLARIPQYVESVVECLKIILLGLRDPTSDRQLLLERVNGFINNVNNLVTERVYVFEPEFCYLIGMIWLNYSDASKDTYLPWFIDAVSIASQYKQDSNFLYYKETCMQLNIWNEVNQKIGEGL